VENALREDFKKFQSTPGLVTRRNGFPDGWTDVLSEFQSTPGLVTRRNTQLSRPLVKPEMVSIHSWSSYQEKLLCKVKDFLSVKFQSTPGLVTRRNALSMSSDSMQVSFNPLLV